MSGTGSERRRHHRKKSAGILRIYSSLTAGAYTIDLKDISEGGAFVKSRHLPRVGETITFIVLDEKFRQRLVGNAVVAWHKDTPWPDENGFGIRFSEKMQDDIVAALAEEARAPIPPSPLSLRAVPSQNDRSLER